MMAKTCAFLLVGVLVSLLSVAHAATTAQIVFVQGVPSSSSASFAVNTNSINAPYGVPVVLTFAPEASMAWVATLNTTKSQTVHYAGHSSDAGKLYAAYSYRAAGGQFQLGTRFVSDVATETTAAVVLVNLITGTHLQLRGTGFSLDLPFATPVAVSVVHLYLTGTYTATDNTTGTVVVSGSYDFLPNTVYHLFLTGESGSSQYPPQLVAYPAMEGSAADKHHNRHILPLIILGCFFGLLLLFLILKKTRPNNACVHAVERCLPCLATHDRRAIDPVTGQYTKLKGSKAANARRSEYAPIDAGPTRPYEAPSLPDEDEKL